MILLENIIELHQKSLVEYGGLEGIRELEMLKSAIERPFQTFDGDELYPSVFQKAAALGESLIKNHAFIDGNKRIGMLAMYSFLLHHGFVLNVPGDTMYNFIISIATGEIHFDEIVLWLQKNCEPVNP